MLILTIIMGRAEWKMSMPNFRFPRFGYFYPYHRTPFNYSNNIRPNNHLNKANVNSNNNSNQAFNNINGNFGITNSNLNNNSNTIKNSSITNDNCNTANKNGFLNFIPKNIGPISINVEGLEDMNKPLFDFLGIQLYLDDIIIICILIFLYQQKVQDESLYLILLLLLL